MPERQVFINVSKEFRGKIKTLKKELTYEQYLTKLLDNSEGKKPSAKDPKMTNQGVLSNVDFSI